MKVEGESRFQTSVYIILVTEFDNLVRDKAKKVFFIYQKFIFSLL